MTRKIQLKGYAVDKAGKLVPHKSRQSVSARIKQAKSKRVKVASKLAKVWAG